MAFKCSPAERASCVSRFVRSFDRFATTTSIIIIRLYRARAIIYNHTYACILLVHPRNRMIDEDDRARVSVVHFLVYRSVVGRHAVCVVKISRALTTDQGDSTGSVGC